MPTSTFPFARQPGRAFACLSLIFALGLPGGADAQIAKVSSSLRSAFPDLPQARDPGHSVALSYQLQNGEQRTWQLRIESELDVMGMVMPKLDEFVVESVYEKSETGYRVTAQLKDMISEIRTRSGSLVIDTQHPERQMADPPFAPFVKIWQVIRDHKVSYRFSEDGVVSDIEIPEAIQQVVKEEGRAFGLTADDMVASLLAGVMQMPSKPVAVGESWEMQVPVPPMKATQCSQTGTLLGVASVEGREMALIGVEFRASQPEKSPMLSELDSTSQGVILFDIEAGEWFRGYTLVESEIVMQVGENELLQTSTSKSTVQRIER